MERNQGAPPPGERGFTLIELMVVVLIVGLLASLAIPTYNEALNKSRRRALVADAHELYKGFMRFHIDEGKFPAEFGAPDEAFNTLTLTPLSTREYYTAVENFNSKLQFGQILFYMAPDVGGLDTEFIAIMRPEFDTDIFVFIAHTGILGGGDWYDGVYLVIGGQILPADEVA